MSKLWWTKQFDPRSVLTDEENRAIAPLWQDVTAERGVVLLNAATSKEAVYTIQSGSVHVQRQSQVGHLLQLDQLQTGDSFGQTPFISRGARDAIAIAQTDVRLLVLKKEAIEQLITRHPQCNQKLFEAITQRLEASRMRWLRKVHHYPPGRLVRLIRTLAADYGEVTPEGIRLECRMGISELGAAIGAGRDTVGDILERFQDDGWLTIDSSYWLIKDNS